MRQSVPPPARGVSVLTQPKVPRCIRRRDFNPAFAGWKSLFGDQFETQLLQVEALTHVQIADEHHDVLDGQIELFAARAKHRRFRPAIKLSLAIGVNYNWPGGC